MKYAKLISESRHFLEERQNEKASMPKSIFSDGAQWMHLRLKEVDPASKRPFPSGVNFTAYGLFKYSVCIIAFFISAVFFYHVHWALVPLAVLVFYFVEVQFLFLFPLLVDNVSNPIFSSIQATRRVGYFTALSTTMLIAWYMLAGLLKRSNPLQQWYVGCIAIIIWYAKEIRNRL